jgi:hypothetical protein
MQGKMPVTKDFRDCLAELEKFGVQYLIIGAYAFGFHAFPRYTKDIDILVNPGKANVRKVNEALEEFGSPWRLDPQVPDQVVQIGVAPNRIDIIREISNVQFADAWRGRIRAPYGDVMVNWIGLKSLISAKTGTGRGRDVEDLKALQEALRKQKGDRQETRKSRNSLKLLKF